MWIRLLAFLGVWYNGYGSKKPKTKYQLKSYMKLLKFLQGKKSYLVALAIFVVGGLEALGYPVADGVFAILTGLGLYSLRDAIKNKK